MGIPMAKLLKHRTHAQSPMAILPMRNNVINIMNAGKLSSIAHYSLYNYFMYQRTNNTFSEELYLIYSYSERII